MRIIQIDVAISSICIQPNKICETLVFAGLKGTGPVISDRAKLEGQLKERSEGDQAQWQTALGEVLAAGS